ncbi:uncharacterized protein B0I36DRAFT_241281, partial [Microdochium trichocladiopsis]
HRGRDSVYNRISKDYWWNNMYREIKEAFKACPECQKASDIKKLDPHMFSQLSDVLTTWVLDMQFMPDDNGYIAIVEARCSLSQYLEVKAI